ncbi:carboxymuconolactone decarboxylase family protein [Mucilaginibacter sabulilitoris]|uniref:hypothetical protein n=1 Tax=Mucilaginibacter sabulilitoris TaxID=1173583 RepID=UPI0038994CB4
MVVSQVNECVYCLAAHTVVGGLQGFTPEQIVQTCQANVHFDTKLDALANLLKQR